MFIAIHPLQLLQRLLHQRPHQSQRTRRTTRTWVTLTTRATVYPTVRAVTKTSTTESNNKVVKSFVPRRFTFGPFAKTGLNCRRCRSLLGGGDFSRKMEFSSKIDVNNFAQDYLLGASESRIAIHNWYFYILGGDHLQLFKLCWFYSHVCGPPRLWVMHILHCVSILMDV